MSQVSPSRHLATRRAGKCGGFAAVAPQASSSNTATANILMPLGMALMVGSEPRIALPIAMSASAAMCLPIATPPNALVFADGRLHAKDFLGIGLIIALLTPALSVLCVNSWYAAQG